MKYFGWVLVFFVAVYILPLASRPLISPDEFRYAEIPREMIATGDYVSPHLLGVRYFEKPVMGYWISAGSMKLFGDNAFSVRFPMALATGLSALFIWVLVREVQRDEKLAALASIIFLSFAAVYGIGTTAVLDSIFSMFVIGSCGCAFMAIQEESFSRRKLLMLILTGLFVGAAFLTKGFLAFVIPGVTIAGYLLWRRRFIEFLIMPLPILLVAAAVIAPWGLAVHRAEPDYWRYFVIVEHWQRFAGGEDAQHAEPWFFYLPVMIIGAFPAALLIPAAGFAGKDSWSKLIRQPFYQYSLCFLLLPLIFFSCSDGKLPTYVLPCFAPLALLIASGVRDYFNSGGHHRSYNWVMTGWGILLLIAGAVMIAGRIVMHRIPAEYLAEIPLSENFWPVMGGVVILAGILMLYSVTGNWRGRLYLFFFGLGLLPLCANWFITGAKKMPEPALRAIERKFKFDPENTLIYTSPSQMHSLAWCYKKSDIKVLRPGEIRYGCEAVKDGETQPLMGIDALDSLLRDPARKYPVLVVLYEDHDEMQRLPVSPLPVFKMHELQAAYYPVE